MQGGIFKSTRAWEVTRLAHRDFVPAGSPVPEINEQEHAAFLLNIQKAILLSLEKRQLLTHSQRQRCVKALEEQYQRKMEPLTPLPGGAVL